MILYLHIHCILQCHTVNCILQILCVLICIILIYDMIYVYTQYVTLCMSYDKACHVIQYDSILLLYMIVLFNLIWQSGELEVI